MSEQRRIWETTREPNLLRNGLSGRYYGRFTLAGKQKWVNLETDVWPVAKFRLADERAKIERFRQTSAKVAAGEAGMADLIALYRRRIEDRVDIMPVTRRRLSGEIGTILKTWPGFANLSPSRLSRQAVLEWRNRLSREGTGFVVPGAKGTSPKINGTSAALINRLIDALRQMLDIAVERGQLGGNPLYGRGLKLPSKPRKPNLPGRPKLEAVFAEIERGSGPRNRSRDTANFCRFIAYTGCRLSEARSVTWADVDFDRGLIRVRGTKTGSANREVPMIPAARALLEKLLSFRETVRGEAVDGKVLVVGEAMRSLARACRKVGTGTLSHHDLRDAFATTAIEAGVDIPTVAAWLGHADGGALLMRVYAHHRRAHSLAQAAKVNF